MTVLRLLLRALVPVLALPFLRLPAMCRLCFTRSASVSVTSLAPFTATFSRSTLRAPHLLRTATLLVFSITVSSYHCSALCSDPFLELLLFLVTLLLQVLLLLIFFLLLLFCAGLRDRSSALLLRVASVRSCALLTFFSHFYTSLPLHNAVLIHHVPLLLLLLVLFLFRWVLLLLPLLQLLLMLFFCLVQIGLRV